MDVDLGKPAYNVSCTPYEDNILVFGGYKNIYKETLITIMGIFDLESETFEPLTNVGKVPIHMSSGSYIRHGDEIYAVMYRKNF